MYDNDKKGWIFSIYAQFEMWMPESDKIKPGWLKVKKKKPFETSTKTRRQHEAKKEHIPNAYG